MNWVAMFALALPLAAADLVPRQWKSAKPTKGAQVFAVFDVSQLKNPHGISPCEPRIPFTNSPQSVTVFWDWAAPTNDICWPQYRYPVEFTVETSTDLQAWEFLTVAVNCDRITVACDAAPRRFFRVSRGELPW